MIKNTKSWRMRIYGFHFCNRGQAMTEYAVALLVLIPICVYLFQSDNLIFDGIRTFFDDSLISIQFMGP